MPWDEIKPRKFAAFEKELDGISRQTMEDHYKLYEGYVKKTNDFDVQVQVVYAEPGSEWTRVGLQARNNLNVGEDPADRNVASGGPASASTHRP